MYDLLIIGAGCNGSYLAGLFARKGYSVKVIEKATRDKVGTRYDVFHIASREFDKLGIPRPQKGDPSWALEYDKGSTADPDNVFPKATVEPIVGLHLHEYTLLLADEAVRAGAEIEYGAEFAGLLYDDAGVICGAAYDSVNGRQRVYAKVVADYSGIAAVARTALPDGGCVENFSLSPDDMFYVTLRYVRILDPSDYLNGSRFWASHKAFMDPAPDPSWAILGNGAVGGFDKTDEVFEDLRSRCKLPGYELQYVERSCTPFRRPPYSLVDDSFIVGGDAGCLTRSDNGEGVTSGMKHSQIAAQVLDLAFRRGDTSRRALWQINVIYNRVQGADFAFLRAVLVKLMNAATMDELEYAFKSDLVSEKLLASTTGLPGQGASPTTLLATVGRLIGGVAKKKYSGATLRSIFQGVVLGTAVKNHYLRFPDDPDGFGEWVRDADEIWENVGNIK